MRHSASALLFLFIPAAVASQTHPPLAKTPPPPQKISPTILAAKTVFFEDRSGVPTVAKAALDELKQWGRFQIVIDKTQADLILLLSASPPRNDHIIYSGGQTGTIDDSGRIHDDTVPNYLASGPARAAYLTIFDAKTGKSLWSDSHQ